MDLRGTLEEALARAQRRQWQKVTITAGAVRCKGEPESV